LLLFLVLSSSRCEVWGKESSITVSKNQDLQVTLVLPLYFDDWARATMLVTSIKQMLSHSNSSIFQSLIIFAPDSQLNLLQPFFSNNAFLPFPIRLFPDSYLIPSTILRHSYPYAIQMALKLLVAKIIRTRFYLTLDADVVMVSPLMSLNQLFCSGRALYEHEPRFSHHPQVRFLLRLDSLVF
jgi:hypothetical protein